MVRMTLAVVALSVGLSATAVSQSGAPAAAIGQKVTEREQALQIAKGRGMAEIKSAELERGVWEVKGRNSSGVFLEVRIAAEDGKVLGADFGHPSPMRSNRQVK